MSIRRVKKPVMRILENVLCIATYLSACVLQRCDDFAALPRSWSDICTNVQSFEEERLLSTLVCTLVAMMYAEVEKRTRAVNVKWS